MIESINGKLLKEMFISGANHLQNNKDLIDKLNVFPVPDGDTGTNMSLTIASAIKELKTIKSDSITDLGKALSKGSLMGARGNSGVILSQIIRGISKSIEGKNDLSVDDFAKALKSGSDTAYKAVIKPIEGTILTVVRESSDFAVKNSKKYKDFVEFMEKLVEEADKSLERTPDLLKNLKDAGVVDSGGKGLVCLYEGMLSALKGSPIRLLGASEETKAVPATGVHSDSARDVDIKFGYCTEFILESQEVDSDTIRDIMMGYGKALEEALKFGQLLTIKIENMRLQHENQIITDEEQEEIDQVSAEDDFVVNEEEKDFGFITTTMGRGLADIFDELGVDIVIEGGQTMNPSTEDFMNAIKMINAKNIFIMPNNSNVIMAANQAKELSEKNVYVVPTKNIPQGISCMVTFDHDADPEANMENFESVLETIKSGEITYAVRDTVMGGIEVAEGDVIGITGKALISSGKQVEEVTRNVIKEMVDDDASIITLYYGEDVEEDAARLFAENIQDEFDDLDVELYYGGQPLYYYLISVE